MPINEKYSYKDFTGQSFVGVDASEFSDSEIVGSCFYQENSPDKTVFPPGMHGVTFTRCNLDNVSVSRSNYTSIVVGEHCSNRRVMVQNDGHDWTVDDALQPVEPASLKYHRKLNLSTDPADLPADLLRSQWVTKADFEAAKNWAGHTSEGKKPGGAADFWFKEKPEIIETQIRGDVTWYLVRGKAWRFRGE